MCNVFTIALYGFSTRFDQLIYFVSLETFMLDLKEFIQPLHLHCQMYCYEFYYLVIKKYGDLSHHCHLLSSIAKRIIVSRIFSVGSPCSPSTASESLLAVLISSSISLYRIVVPPDSSDSFFKIKSLTINL